MNRSHLASGLFWLALSIFVLVKAVGLGFGTFSSPGAGFLIFWSSLVLGLLSIVLVVSSLVGKAKALSLRDLWKGLKWSHAALAILILSLYAFILPRLGFLLASFVLMTLLFSMRHPKYWVNMAAAMVTVTLSYAFFHLFLQVPFPRGIFGW